jgi:hypothetical protein
MVNSCETKPKGLKPLLKSWYFWKPFLGVIIGATAGFLYYHFYGCQSGTCAITSDPFMSIAFGGLFGYFIVARPCSTC